MLSSHTDNCRRLSPWISGSVSENHHLIDFSLSYLKLQLNSTKTLVRQQYLKQESVISIHRYYSAEAVLWAVGATALVSLAMSLFSLQSKVSTNCSDI